MSTFKSRKNNRRTLYLSDKKDQDILQYIDPLIGERYDFSFVIRELVRDGIKYRSSPKAASPSPQVVHQENGIQSNPKELPKVELERKELSDKDIEDRLDSF
ncbi:hypothetical protein SP3_00056 [Bacillus phage fHSPT3]|nr:hypothetical protein MAWWA_140 [Bacillus phage vB_BspH_Mawwa]